MSASVALSQRESALNLILVLRAHTLLGLWLGLGLKLPYEVYIPISLLACLAHQRCISEWIHESAHLNFVTGRKWNDLWTHLLLGVFFMNDIKQHRYAHSIHHRQRIFFQPEDGDTCHLTVRTKRDLIQGVLSDLSGFSAIKMFTSRESAEKSPKTPGLKLAFLIAHVSIALMLWRVGLILPYSIYMACLGTLYPLMNRIRVYAQHSDFTQKWPACESTVSRDMAPTLLGRLFFTSDLMRFHLQHHLKPSAPFRQLGHGVNPEPISHLLNLREVYRRLANE